MRDLLYRVLFFGISFFFLAAASSAQPALSFDLKKPKKYEDRLLGSEKSAEKKFTFTRRIYQNTVTHYNWYFNANNRVNEIIDRAKTAHLDDFSQLLPFYNYSLEHTIRDSADLDSVIYKANAGILIHDLRNAWIDNLFMLLGKAYFFKKEFDSAYQTFQYINYAFAPKEKDGYDIPIGSNATEGGNAFSISTKENNSLLKKMVSTPPSRNESFIWQIKTFLEKDELVDAAVMIETLRKDPAFPGRLQTDLHEVEAYYFYKKNQYDSAAHFLAMALDNANNKFELSRWEYLIAQLHEKSLNPEMAREFYARAIKHGLDPVLEVYARLNSIKQNKADSAAIEENIRELVKMGRKDRYTRYRDIIYFTAAQIELERNNLEGARAFLLQSARASDPNSVSSRRSMAYLMLGDLAYDDKQYLEARSFYDSLSVNDPVVENQVAFARRIEILNQIREPLLILQRQDSLQKLAAMPEDEREIFLKKRLRALRKLQGLQEEETPADGGVQPGRRNQETVLPDMFNTRPKGEWYFYNQDLKSKGFSAFKAKWGNRPNMDNWRRSGALSQQGPSAGRSGDPTMTGEVTEGFGGELTYEGLLKNIPLSPEQQALMKDSIEQATFELSRAYFNGLEDYRGVINLLDTFPGVYPNSPMMPEVVYMLFVSHTKTGNTARAKDLFDFMQASYAGDPLERKMARSVAGENIEDIEKEITRTYENIYTLFIEGNFEEAIRRKNDADVLYGTTYWTPQLLYINSIYLFRQRQDVEGKKLLGQLIELYRETPMAQKAQELLDLVNRRKDLEEYLTALQVERPTEDSIVITQAPPPIKKETVIITPDPARDSADIGIAPEPAVDTLVQQPVVTVKEPEKKDSPVVTQKEPVKKDTAVVIQKEPVKKDTPEVVQPEPEAAVVRQKIPEPAKPGINQPDTAQANRETPLATTYSHNPGIPHFVIMITDKVDPVYVTESRNAFNRYNQQRHASKSIAITNQVLENDTRLMVMSGFLNAEEARAYVSEVRKNAASAIIPWLPADKYNFIVISSRNYEVLLNTKTLNTYREFEARYFKE